MSLNILLVTGIFPPDSGGPAKFSSDFASWCAKNGLQVSVVTYGRNSSMQNMGKFPYSVIFARPKKLLMRRFLGLIKIIGNASNRSNLPVLAAGAFLETYLASLIFGFNYIAKVPGDIVWERARNNQITRLGIEEFQNSKLSLRYAIFRWAYTRSLLKASVVIVPSLGLFQLCRSWGIPEGKLRIIRNSIEIENYSIGNRKEVSYDVVTVCRLVPWKGVDELIRFCSTRKLKLLIIGDGPERQSLQILSQSLGSDTVFFGDIQHKEVINLLRKSRIFVLNSSYEGLPHALIEARACGLVTVARDGTGSAEVITDGIDGFLVREDRSFSQTLDLALAAANWGNAIGERAVLDSKLRFCRDSNFREIIDLIVEAQA